MRFSKIALGVAAGISGAATVNAADVAMFPYIVNSNTVTTIVTIFDRGRATTGRYDKNGNSSTSGGYLHWSMHYKQGVSSEPVNEAPCDNANPEAYIPTNPNGIVTVDLKGHFSNNGSNGVLFNDNNASNPEFDETNLIEDISLPTRGVLFVNNSDDQTDIATGDYTRNYVPDERVIMSTTAGTVQGEAMIFEFAGGAAWGYKAETKDSGNRDDAADFSYTDSASTGIPGKPWPLVTFMPLNEVDTKLAVIPVDDWREGMFGNNGRGGRGDMINRSVTVGLRAVMPLSRAPVRGDSNVDPALYENNNIGVAFNRDGDVVPGAVDVKVNCVGAVKVGDLMTSAARQALENDGGYGLLSVISDLTTQYIDRAGHAIVYKVEYKDITSNSTFNGVELGAGFHTFNNGMKL